MYVVCMDKIPDVASGLSDCLLPSYHLEKQRSDLGVSSGDLLEAFSPVYVMIW